MKDVPIIPIVMWTAFVVIIFNSHRVGQKSQVKVEHSMAAGVDAHMSNAREAFIKSERIPFLNEVEEVTKLLTKEAYCDDCIDSKVAKENLPRMIDLRNAYYNNDLRIETIDKVFGSIVKALAKNHLLYTLEHIGEIKDEFYLEDAIRHLKYSMEYAPEELREKEAIAKATLEEALLNHNLDSADAREALEAVVTEL
ncbi:MAG: hypothetical protein RJQ09_06110 [Cyclobacteriaceae bacterium]